MNLKIQSKIPGQKCNEEYKNFLSRWTWYNCRNFRVYSVMNIFLVSLTLETWQCCDMKKLMRPVNVGRVLKGKTWGYPCYLLLFTINDFFQSGTHGCQVTPCDSFYENRKKGKNTDLMKTCEFLGINSIKISDLKSLLFRQTICNEPDNFEAVANWRGWGGGGQNQFPPPLKHTNSYTCTSWSICSTVTYLILSHDSSASDSLTLDLTE